MGPVLMVVKAQRFPRFGLARNRFAWPRRAERRDSLERWPGMPIQEMRTSSAIERVGYNPITRDLSVWFDGWRRYIYSNVPPDIYRSLCDAPSTGRFINAVVKGRFDCRCDPPRRRYPA